MLVANGVISPEPLDTFARGCPFFTLIFRVAHLRALDLFFCFGQVRYYFFFFLVRLGSPFHLGEDSLSLSSSNCLDLDSRSLLLAPRRGAARPVSWPDTRLGPSGQFPRALSPLDYIGDPWDRPSFFGLVLHRV